MVTKKILDLREMLQQRERPAMVVSICLRGDLTSEIYRLDAELEKVRKGTEDLRLTGNAEAKKLAEQIKKLEADAAQFSVDVKVRALERGQWADLVAKHPPKDKGLDFDVSIYNDAIPACIVEPEMDADTRGKFLDGLTQGQWDELAGAVHSLNVGDGSIPFSRLASRALQESDGK